MARRSGKPLGVREAARMSTLTEVKRALKKNAMALAVLKEQRADLLNLKTSLESSRQNASNDDAERIEDARTQGEAGGISAGKPRIAS